MRVLIKPCGNFISFKLITVALQPREGYFAINAVFQRPDVCILSGRLNFVVPADGMNEKGMP